MIIGTVNANEDAVVRFLVRGTGGILHETEAVVDTGFNGFVSLPSSLISALGLPFVRTEQTLLANGSREEVAVHEGTIFWDAGKRTVLVQATDGDPLIGMALMRGYELTVQVRINGDVFIKPMAPGV